MSFDHRLVTSYVYSSCFLKFSTSFFYHSFLAYPNRYSNYGYVVLCFNLEDFCMFYASFIHNFRFISCNHIIMMLIVYASILTLHFTVGADWSRAKQTKQSKSSKKTKMLLKSQLTGSQTYSASVTRKAESTNHIIIFYWFKYVRNSCGYIHSFMIGFKKKVSNIAFVDMLLRINIYNNYSCCLHRFMIKLLDLIVI